MFALAHIFHLQSYTFIRWVYRFLDLMRVFVRYEYNVLVRIVLVFANFLQPFFILYDCRSWAETIVHFRLYLG